MRAGANEREPGGFMRRRSILKIPLAAAVPALARAAAAADGPWPQRTVRLVVPYAAGGGPDLLARQLADKLGPRLGQTVIVENKVGAGGVVGAETVAQAAPDGYTLMLGASTHVTQKLLAPQARFDPLTGFTHVIRVSTSPSLLVVSASAPYRSVGDLVAAARREPGRLNYASGGVGSAAHLCGAALAVAAGMEVVHVPYRGSVEILPSLANGDTHFAFPVAATALPLAADGKLRVLATTGAARLPMLPAVPTLREAMGRDELVLDAWSGLWAPAGLPDAIAARLHAETLKALADPQVAQAFAAGGSAIAPTRSPDEFTRFVLAETAKYAKLIVAARIA